MPKPLACAAYSTSLTIKGTEFPNTQVLVPPIDFTTGAGTPDMFMGQPFISRARINVSNLSQ